jgi:ribonucleotide reductase alpha subunit
MSVELINFEQVENLCTGLKVEAKEVYQKIKELGMMDAARVFGFEIYNPDYIALSGKLLMTWLHSVTPNNVSDYLRMIGHRLNKQTKEFFEKHKVIIDEILNKNKVRDLDFDWFSGATMMKTYLAKANYDEEPCESPQFLYMRIAVQLYYDEGIESVLDAYEEMSNQYYTHASPTIFNGGMKKPQMSSCFLYTIDDNLESILTGVVEGGLISKASGGLGLDIARIRHSEIGSSGISNGIVPMLRVYNEMAKYCDQGGKRKGAINIYNRPHHIDIFPFVDMVKKKGDHNLRAHDINTTIWCSWLFWKRIKNKDKWTLFCPAKTKELNDLWGEEFEKKYVEYEILAEEREKHYLAINEEVKRLEKELSIYERPNNETYRNAKHNLSISKKNRIVHKVIRAEELLKSIVETQRNAGMPYIMHGDAINIKSNHRHLGYIRSSNLCLEICEYTSNEEIASCLTADTLIQTNKGLVKIQDFSNQKVRTVFPSDNDFEFDERYTDSMLIDQGKRVIYQINTHEGLSVKATHDHMFLTYDSLNDKYEWIPVYLFSEDFELVFGVNHPKCNLNDEAFEMGKNCLLNDLLKKTLEYDLIDYQYSFIMGYLISHCEFTNNTYYLNIEKDKTSDLFNLLLSIGIIPIYLNNCLMISGVSAKKITNVLNKEDQEDDLVEQNFVMYKISNIVTLGEEQVYDLFVPDRNHFIANSIVSHNCNLASISLKKFVMKKFDRNNNNINSEIRSSYDFDKLSKISRSVTRNLNKVIDKNWYPLDDTSFSKNKISEPNKRHRPLGIGVSGFAEAIYGLDLTFELPETKLVNKCIFACMYFNCIIESIILAFTHGHYASFEGSPFSEGKLQFDLWKEEFLIKGPNSLRKAEDDDSIQPSTWGQKVVELPNGDKIQPTWDDLKRCIKSYGVYNSLFLALMPTASTAQILKNTETTEAPLSNLYSRKVMNGAYPVLNNYMVKDLEEIGCWNENTVKYLVANEGSLSGFIDYVKFKKDLYGENNKMINRLEYLQQKYKTMWELKQGIFLRMAADRGRYIDQSQSTNIYLKDPQNEELYALHLQTDLLGLKTGMYYLRSKAAAETVKFTADTDILRYVTNTVSITNDVNDSKSCSRDNPNCLSCQ